LLVRSIAAYASGELIPRAQDHARATYAPKISTEQARIDWASPARRIRNLVRACNPEPGAWTTVRGARLKVFATTPVPLGRRLRPGEVDASSRLVVGTGDDELELIDVQIAGRRRLLGADAVRGLRLGAGERLE
jgi:methionyl-tRNA formyltransferase